MDYWEEDLYADTLDKAMCGDPISAAKLLGYMVGSYIEALKGCGVEKYMIENLALDYQYELTKEKGEDELC